MKSILERLFERRNKYWDFIQISILIGIFSYFFVENFILSQSWEVLSLRSIDDYAMQDSIHSMQKALLAGDWKRVFGFFDYAYGNAFWLFNAILLLPLYLIGNAQALIVVGREISLFFVFGSVYFIGLIIDRLWPNARSLKYPILITIATMPMVSIIATKLHVNAQSIFFGIVSFYLLICEPILTKKTLFWSGVLAGMAVGFKLTGIFITPLLGLTLLDKLRQQNKVSFIKNALMFSLPFTFMVAFCTAPALLLFPFYMKELGTTYSTFLLFKDMTSTQIFGAYTLIIDGFGFYISPLALSATFFLLIRLIFIDIKRCSYISLFIFITIFISMFLLVMIVNKAPLYIATYIMSIGFFLPLGFLGLSTVSISNLSKIVIVYAIIIASLFSGHGYRNHILKKYRFFEINKSEDVKNQLYALNEMKQLLTPLKIPVRILQDNTSIFPGTKFTDGIDVAINYGNLKEKSTWGKFDYILLNSDTYFGKKVNTYNDDNLEEETRNTLRETGYFYGRKYKLIYNKYDALLYQLEVQ